MYRYIDISTVVGRCATGPTKLGTIIRTRDEKKKKKQFITEYHRAYVCSEFFRYNGIRFRRHSFTGTPFFGYISFQLVFFFNYFLEFSRTTGKISFTSVALRFVRHELTTIVVLSLTNKNKKFLCNKTSY